MNYWQEKTYVGNLRQLFGVREARLSGGKSDGIRVVDLHNGGDLSLCVAVDRCMDIPELRYRGRIIHYITPNGLVHPAYYSCFGEGWSESFAGGLLYTCGLTHIGPREDLDWLTQKEHGSIANTPAQNFSIDIQETRQGPQVILRGTMHEGMLAGVNLTLTRTIRMQYLTNQIEIEDTVKNEGYRSAPHMILYHCNLGYPLLQPDSICSLPHHSVRPRTPFAQSMLPHLDEILPPQDQLEEMCYYYTPLTDALGWAHIRMENQREHLGMTLSLDTDTLPMYIQWKNFVKGEYVMGLEPTNCTIDGRADAQQRNTLRYLEPGQQITYRLRFRFDPGCEELL